MSFVFAPSLLGPRQDATLALHKCWADDGERTARGPGGAPAPPLMVMVAAMLRSPSLDAVRLASPLEDVKDWFDVPCRAQRLMILDLVAKDDVEGIETLQMAKLDKIAVQDSLPHCVHQALVWSVLDTAVLVAWRTKSYRGLAAAIKRLTTEYPQIYHDPLARSVFRKDDDDDVSPLVSVCPLIMQDIFAFGAARPDMGNNEPIAGTALEDALRVHHAAASEACTRLPMGDVRALLELHRHDADLSGFLADVLAHVALGAFGAMEARAALVALNHGDVAAMLYAAAPDSDAADLGAVHAAARDVEFPGTLVNHMAEQYDASSGNDFHVPCGRLMKAFNADGSAAVRLARAPITETRHVLLSRFGTARRQPRAPYRSRGDFERCWKRQLQGLLGDDWDWSNCVAAGGAVVRALVGQHAANDGAEDSASFRGDVDLFFYGLSYAEQRRRLQQLERHVRRTVGAGHYAVLLTSRTATIVVEGAPRLQVALGRWSSLADVLSTCDVDCCGAGYDGRDVWLTGRAAAAYATRTNVAGAMGHVVRGSIAYEMRLWKYAARYGFAVLDPLHDAARAADALAELVAEATGGAGAPRSKVAVARHVATNLSGLRWLMAVDAGLLEPVDAVSDLEVGGSTTLAMVLAKVTAKGYIESESYGNREEGYVVAQEEGSDDVAAVQSGSNRDHEVESMDRGKQGKFEWATTIFNHDFAQRVAITNVDVIDVEDLDPAAWRL